MNLSKLSEILKDEPKYRYAQINQALWQDYVSSWDEISSLPKALREKLSVECPLEIKAEMVAEAPVAQPGRSAKPAGRIGQGGTKALITLDDGEIVETVLIRQKRGNTICVSSQVGCPLGCAFCATGALGFKRNLAAEEIIEQVIFWARELKRAFQTAEAGAKIDNVVFMGMGEPFLNYQEFIKAAKFINDAEKLNIGARRLSVSTAGLTEGIKRLSGEKLQMNLAISLHAPLDGLRASLMPIAKKYPLAEIFKAIDNYILKTGRRVMFEYLMLKGINDSDEDAELLAQLMRKPLYLVNLIPYNLTGRFQTSSRERIDAFQKILETNNVAVTVRLSFGANIGAACGQLGKRRLNK